MNWSDGELDMSKHSFSVHKLDPRLRVIKNGSDLVNNCRSKLSTQVASGSQTSFKFTPLEDGLDIASVQTASSMLSSKSIIKHRKKTKSVLRKRKKLEESLAPDSSFVNVMIDVFNNESNDSKSFDDSINRIIQQCDKALDGRTTPIGASKPFVRGNQVVATVPISFLKTLSQNPDVSFVSLSESIKLELPQPRNGINPTNRRINKSNIHNNGKDIIIGIIDVGGYDFSHPDFLDDSGKTRFSSIWDQGGNFRPPPKGFQYGSEFTEEHLNAALKEQNTGNGIPAVILEKQSQQTTSSHATHVASIAAGNKGICSKAEIIGVLIDVPQPQDTYERRRQTFSDTSRIIHAVDYMLKIADEKKKQISINISLGTNGGAHDGLSGTNRWFDNALSVPGRSITMAAGNSGQDKPEYEDDTTWIMGRIHTNGKIASRGLSKELEWVVVGNGIEDLSENELEIWYNSQDRFIVELLPPGESKWISAKPQEFVENKRLKDGTNISIYNELYHPTNGENYISIYLSPNLEPSEIRGIRSGIWRVRLVGEEIRNGQYHCWIERDDPHEFGIYQGKRLFRFPSFFSLNSNVDSHSISSLACGRSTIAVSNYDQNKSKVNSTSSQGPTRDGRQKPDIAAPGTDIIAANGFAQDGKKWVSMSGTSMASPYVTGVIGLMMNSAKGPINSIQCLGILQRTSRPLPGSTYEWKNDTGFGCIDPEEAIKQAEYFSRRIEKT
ncbi:S8 family serine peptidase [Marinicella meishanensis]|uniref:S8 family serine peptidase n=1 Tax=Marinicella meishanensis TaxID=2873263 RepID=UPI001CBE27AE|nr:S8 family serine peptidase [Marinicella sp. NBU2979]